MSRVDAEGVVDETFEPGPLEVLFGGPARTRIIEAFVSERGRDLTVSDVARLSDTSRSTVYRHLDDLQELGVVETSRTTGDGYSTRYQLAASSEIADGLHELEGLVLRRLLDTQSKN